MLILVYLSSFITCKMLGCLQYTPLRSLEEVTAEILALERETEGLLKKRVSFGEAD